MQRTWRRAWLRGKPHYMQHKPVRKAHTDSIKAKVYDLTVKAAQKLAPAAAAAGIFLSSLAGVQANPTGGTITAGTGSIIGQGTNHVTINQTSDKLAINWNSFNIGNGEKVQFIQPGASAIALNRVLGNNASAIYGQLSANGKVFLINPNGVLFAQGAQVNVGGLVASTLNLSDQDFMNGKYLFSGDSQQGVLNQGNITVANGGYAALLGAGAVNEGVILAKEGTVALGAGSKIALDFTGDGLLTLSLDESKVQAEVKNSGLIKADGGLVVMNAKAADALTGSVVNNTGTIEAKSVTTKNGVIILTGDSVTTAGTLDASGNTAGETGGTVKVLGDTVRLAAGAAIDVSGDQGGGTALVGGAYQGGAGEYAATKTVVEQGTSINADAIHTGNGGQVVVWANDTTSFAGAISAKGGQNGGNGGGVETSGKKTLTVADTASVNTTAANGKTGNWLLDPADFVVDGTGAKGMTAAALSAALQSSGVTITTTGGDASVTGASGVTDAPGNGDITINSAVNWSAAGNVLTLSAHRNISINANVTASGTNAGLALTYGTGVTGSYSLGSGAKITLSGASAKFSLNGSDYSVINSHSTGGALTALQNIENGLAGNYFLGEDIDASATATWNPKGSGGYFGFDPIGDWDNNFTGRFDGGGHTISGLTINRGVDNVGLFARTGTSSDIRNVGLVGGSVSGSSHVGGLVGTGYGSITNSYNSGSVSGSGSSTFVGGLVGYQQSGSITNSYNSGNVSGGYRVGGLIGNAYISSITNSYNSGSVSGSGGSIGGLAGANSSSITNSYNIGDVIGSNEVGGLAGYNSSSITNSYNSGSVGSSGSTKVGGLAGYNSSSITNSYNIGDVTGSNEVGGLAGYNSSSITNSYNSGSVTGSTEVGGLVGYKLSGSVTDSFYATTDASGNSINNGGTTGGAWSGNGNGMRATLTELRSAEFWTTGYGKPWSVDTAGGADKIWRVYDGHTTPLLKSFLTQITVNADNKSKTYDGAVYSGAPTNVTYAPGTDFDLLLGTPTYGNARNAGTYGLGLYSVQKGYDIVYGSGMLTINKADLTASLTGTVTKTYNGNNSATLAGSNYSLSGLVSGDTVNVSGTATYNDKNVGTGKGVMAKNLTLGGADAGNYNLTSSTATANIGEITPKTLTAYLTGSVTKTYDGTDAATLTGGNYSALVGIIGGDAVSLNIATSGSYADKNAGNGKSVTVSGLSLSGAGAGNYQLASTTLSGNIGTINQKALSATQTAAVTKTYDRDKTATFDSNNIALNATDIIAGDIVNIVSGTGMYDSVNAGDRSVTVTGVTLDNANYKLDTASIIGSAAGKLAGKIEQKALSATQTAAVTKTYSKTDSAVFDNANLTLEGVIEGDTVGVSGTGTYDSVNAGDRTVTVTGVTLDNANYKIDAASIIGSAAGKLAGKIDKAALTITANNAEKIYDKLAYEGGNGVTFGGLVGGETSDVLSGTLTYGGTAQGATEAGTYTITIAGLTATNYDITFRDGTLTIKPAAITDPGYIAAVQNRQQSAGNNTEGASETHGQPANDASSQLPAGQASPIQYSSDTNAAPRVITTAGETVTIAQDSLLQLAADPVQKEIAVYQTINGSSELAGVYQVDGSQGSLTLRTSAAAFAPVPSTVPAPAAAQAETASFQLTDRQGNTATFTATYTDGSLYVQAANAPAADMLSQNRQLVTAASLVAVQDKLGLDINNLQAVYLGK